VLLAPCDAEGDGGMSGMSAEQRADLVEALLPDAAGLVCAVREETREQITARLRGLSRHELEVVAVVLAALADPDQSLRESFGWINFDEHGAPLERRSSATRTVREVPSTALPHTKGRSGVDEVAVERALHGDPQPLNASERSLAVDRGIRRGLSYDLVAERLGMKREAVEQAWGRAKRKAHAEGRHVPKQQVGEIATAA
jgi:DNA-binding CsgD family transcriptional regulator